MPRGKGKRLLFFLAKLDSIATVCATYYFHLHADDGVERIHVVRSFHPEGEEHHMPRRLLGTPAEHERKRHCAHAGEGDNRSV